MHGEHLAAARGACWERGRRERQNMMWRDLKCQFSLLSSSPEKVSYSLNLTREKLEAASRDLSHVSRIVSFRLEKALNDLFSFPKAWAFITSMASKYHLIPAFHWYSNFSVNSLQRYYTKLIIDHLFICWAKYILFENFELRRDSLYFKITNNSDVFHSFKALE